MNQHEVSKMRQEMGEIAFKLLKQDQQLSAIAQSVASLQEFSEASLLPPESAEPANFKEQINQSARSERERDEIARLYGFANFNEIPADIEVQA